MRNLLDIPPEVTTKILGFLTAKDILSVSQSCKTLYQATKIDSVWKHFCLKDYGVRIKEMVPFSYREIYTKLLHHYGQLIGLWQSDVMSYGGLLQIKFDKFGLLARELHPPVDPQVTDPLRLHPLFNICLDDTGEVITECLSGYGDPHNAKIVVKSLEQFSFKCCEQEKHCHPSGKHREFLEWYSGETSRSFEPRAIAYENQELLLMKFLLIRQYNCIYQYQRVSLQEPIVGVPVQPGMFKGTYGGHGLELILLTYEEENTLAKAIKVTGDPNVPAREVTFHVNLNFPMVLTTLDEQRSISSLSNVQPVEVPFDKINQKPPSEQPFLTPLDCHERFSEIPKVCVNRYHGWGQIAGHGFSNPSFTQGHWIVFNENLFGFIWLELRSMSVYHRVMELS